VTSSASNHPKSLPDLTLEGSGGELALDAGTGPAVVALGGGHGLAASLKAAASYADSVVGVVSVADDGGSSGRLRQEFGVEAPGDARRCVSALASLADAQNLLGTSLEYRFDSGELAGHPVGNLLLAGLTLACGGDFRRALAEVCRLVGLDRAAIIPATEMPVVLEADSDSGPLRGQVRIEHAAGIHNLRFDPPNPPVSREALRAVIVADQVLVGPGSLFTSVLAAVGVPQILDALNQSQAQRVFIANVANERALARGFGLSEHIGALVDHGIKADVVLVDGERGESFLDGILVVSRPLTAADGWSHDVAALGCALSELYECR